MSRMSPPQRRRSAIFAVFIHLRTISSYWHIFLLTSVSLCPKILHMDNHTVPQQDGETRTTTTRFPVDLWERARLAAIKQKTTAQRLCAEGLQLRLALLEDGMKGLERAAKLLNKAA
jgi:hypothetical protein